MIAPAHIDIGSHWICQTCGQPISPEEGLIELVNADSSLGPIGGYPVEGTRRASQPAIDLRVYHHPDCDPTPEHQGYWFPTDRARDPGEWMAWAIHLVDKTWMSPLDIKRFLRFWWTHKGEAPPDV